MFSDNRGQAISAEYLLLLGISIMVMSGLYMAFSSFEGTAADDACAASSFLLAGGISSQAARLVGDGGASGCVEVTLPDSINGRPYVVYPFDGGIVVAANFDDALTKYYYPAIFQLPGVAVEGFMASACPAHRIEYDRYSKTVRLT